MTKGFILFKTHTNTYIPQRSNEIVLKLLTTTKKDSESFHLKPALISVVRADFTYILDEYLLMKKCKNLDFRLSLLNHNVRIWYDRKCPDVKLKVLISLPSNLTEGV